MDCSEAVLDSGDVSTGTTGGSVGSGVGSGDVSAGITGGSVGGQSGS